MTAGPDWRRRIFPMLVVIESGSPLWIIWIIFAWQCDKDLLKLITPLICMRMACPFTGECVTKWGYLEIRQRQTLIKHDRVESLRLLYVTMLPVSFELKWYPLYAVLSASLSIARFQKYQFAWNKHFVDFGSWIVTDSDILNDIWQGFNRANLQVPQPYVDHSITFFLSFQWQDLQYS